MKTVVLERITETHHSWHKNCGNFTQVLVAEIENENLQIPVAYFVGPFAKINALTFCLEKYKDCKVKIDC